MEEEKIFAGKLFDARTKELKDIKHKAHVLCQKFNQMDKYDPDRLPIIKEFIGSIGNKYYMQGPIQFNYVSHTFIGENFVSNFNFTVMDDGKIFIGDNAVIGAGSVVTKDIPSDCVAYGNPCKAARKITEADSKMDLL